MVTTLCIQIKDDDDSCANSSFEYSCDLHERWMKKKRKTKSIYM